MTAGVVIAGGGQGGYQVAASLRAEGYQEPVFLVSQEPGIPYQRPPLSKGYLLGKQTVEQLTLRPESFYRDHSIELLAGEGAVSILRDRQRLKLASGRELAYDILVLATGARNRTLPIPGGRLEGVLYLRTLAEAAAIKQRMENSSSVVVIGGGFIGLEVAATARTMGKAVTVIEALPRLMPRAATAGLSEYYRVLHESHGVELLLGAAVERIRAGEVRLEGGARRAADLIVVGIGIVPNVELAGEAGLPVANGIAVDQFLRTPDEHIYAIGDCAEYPSAFLGARARLESVQNAVDQAVSVARAIVGKSAPYTALPWFWSDQYDARLQMAGLADGCDRSVERGAIEGGKFSLFHFRAGRLRAVDSINRPADHVAARKLLAAGAAITPEQAGDESLDLKRLVGAGF